MKERTGVECKLTKQLPTINKQQSHNFIEEWKAFKRALTKSRDPFNPFAWIFRLAAAAGRDVCELTGLSWRPIVPLVAVTLVLAVAGSYAKKLRPEVLQPRWCDEATTMCTWMLVHDILVAYFVAMILFHYVRASLLSPGILITGAELSRKSSLTSLDVCAEQKLLDLYGSLRLGAIVEKSRSKIMHYHPCPNPSTCDKCNSVRPSRCHHCRICNRCVLQFDHHCVWLNNCVGYSNVRSFILTLFYITTACWYGVLLLYKPFYGPLQEQLRQYGGLLNYIRLYISNNITDGNGLFHLISVKELTSIVFSPEESLPVQVVVDVVFPFLLAVGVILTVFLGTHLKYILTAVTTLEHRVALAQKYDALMAGVAPRCSLSIPTENWVNPFDQGSYYRNWKQIMGSSWAYLFLPIPVAPPLPYNPGHSKKKQ